MEADTFFNNLATIVYYFLKDLGLPLVGFVNLGSNQPLTSYGTTFVNNLGSAGVNWVHTIALILQNIPI
jgi:hypothetical protein